MAGSWVRAKLHRKEGAVCGEKGWKVHLGLEPGNWGRNILTVTSYRPETQKQE